MFLLEAMRNTILFKSPRFETLNGAMRIAEHLHAQGINESPPTDLGGGIPWHRNATMKL
jgi:hypothetical protein